MLLEDRADAEIGRPAPEAASSIAGPPERFPAEIVGVRPCNRIRCRVVRWSGAEVEQARCAAAQAGSTLPRWQARAK
jgi:hypothetical protein